MPLKRRVRELWRYPVKSLQGERLHEAIVTADGIGGDRRYAIFDLDTGLGLTGPRVPELLLAAASMTEDGGVRITLPDGTLADGDRALSEWLGRRSGCAPAVRDGHTPAVGALATRPSIVRVGDELRPAHSQPH